MTLQISRTDLSQADVIDLLELHHSEMVASSPPGTCHVLDLTGLKTQDVEVFAARNAGKICAIGAIKRHTGFAEIKSMRAHPDARGTGAGKAMLEHLIARSRELGFDKVKLETGSGPVFEAAVGLYEKFGFEPCGSFAGYVPGTFNKLYALKLV
ncbi:MAG: GNAT family N-acetyltransferase [Pseudomonadota bacterium]